MSDDNKGGDGEELGQSNTLGDVGMGTGPIKCSSCDLTNPARPRYCFNFNCTLQRLRDNDTTLTELTLFDEIGVDGARVLATALKVNKTLTKLDTTWDHKIGDDGACELAVAVKNNKTITKLDLSSNKIGVYGARALADALKNNKTLTYLNLSDNDIGDGGALELANALKENETLTELSLAENEICIDGARELADALKVNNTLTKLNLIGSNIGDDGARELANAVKENATLTELNLASNKIGDDGARELATALKKNKTLTELNLMDNKLGIEGARTLANALKTNKTLTELNLLANKIGDNGARELANALKVNDALTELSLAENNISVAGALELVNALKVNDTLTKLNLCANDIGVAGTRELANALKESGNKILTKLDLGFNGIGDGGALELANAFKENTTITSLCLCQNNIGADGARAWAHTLKGNNALTELNLNANEIGDNGARELADALKENATLTSLDLRFNRIVDGGALELANALKDNMALTMLNLEHNEIGVAVTGIIESLLDSNKLLHHKCKGGDASFYFENGDCSDDSLHIKDTVWEAVSTSDGRVLRAVYHSLKAYLDETNKSDLKQLFDTALHPENGSPLLHLAAAKNAFEFCKLLVEEIGVDFDTVLNSAGQTARSIAEGNPIMHKWAKSVGTFLGRYFIEKKDLYKSATCVVHFAVDVEKPKGHDERNVAIKIMENESQFKRELEHRLKDNIRWVENGVDIETSFNTFDCEHAVPLLRYHEVELEEKIVRCLVMPQGQRNLDEIIRYEGLAGRDSDKIHFFAKNIALALQHLHQKGVIHGDFKPRNIVRIHGDYKLIDFDATVPIGGKLTEKCSTGYLPPEIAKIKFRPQQTKDDLKVQIMKLEKDIAQAESNKKRELTKELWRLEDMIKQIESPGSGTTEEPTTHEQMDIWSYGVVMYQMLTGSSLFNCDASDNLLNEDEKLRLANWGGVASDKLDLVLCKGDQEMVTSAKQLLNKCLSTKTGRIKSFDQVLAEPFLNRSVAEIQQLKDGQNQLKQGQNELKQGQRELKIFIGNLTQLQQNEFKKTQQVLLHAVFEANEVEIPTTFVILNKPLPDLQQTPSVGESIEDHENSEDMNGRLDQAKIWVEKLVDGNILADTKDIAKKMANDLVVGNEMYFYWIDELTGEPVRADGFPIAITTPADLVPKLLPFVKAGMCAMSLYNGTAGIARMFGFCPPIIPEDFRSEIKASVKILQQKSSVEAFRSVHARVETNDETPASELRGHELRKLKKFFETVEAEDPYAGLRRIPDRNGRAIWTAKSRAEVPDVLQRQCFNRITESKIESECELEKLSLEKKQLEKDLSTSSKKNKQLEKDLSSSNEEKKQHEKYHLSSNEKKKQLEKDLSTSNEEKQRLEKDLLTSIEKKNQLEKDLSTSNEKKNQLEKDLLTSNEKKKQLERELDDIRSKPCCVVS